MSDKFPRGEQSPDKDVPNKHGIARRLAEAAAQARAEGDPDRADLLLEEARRTDPTAVEDVLSERGRAADLGPQDDAELEAMSRTVEPGSDAPSRAGITGSGSGADDMG